MKNLVVGAGISGAVLANLIATELNEEVVVIDRRNVIAGNIYDYADDETGIIVHKYGPHLFHTNNKKVWDFLSKYTKWHPFFYKPNGFIEGKMVNLPFNLNSLYKVFSAVKAQKIEEKLVNEFGYGTNIPILNLMQHNDEDIKFISNYIYENVFKNYSIKQWGINPDKIDTSVLARVPVRISNDNRYFLDKYQAIPLNGYTKMVENILNHPLITVKLNTEYKDITEKFDRIFYSGSVDELLDYKYGILPYRSLYFDIQKHYCEYYQQAEAVNYPNNFDFTRIVEHKHFLNQKSSKTIISVEYPQQFEPDKNERFYPISNPENEDLYNKYAGEMKQVDNFYFIGRLGTYKYLNMDTAIERVMELFYNSIYKEKI